MKFHILKLLYDLESHAKDGRYGLSRNEDIRRFVGKLVEKQTIVFGKDANNKITVKLLCNYLCTM